MDGGDRGGADYFCLPACVKFHQNPITVEVFELSCAQKHQQKKSTEKNQNIIHYSEGKFQVILGRLIGCSSLSSEVLPFNVVF